MYIYISHEFPYAPYAMCAKLLSGASTGTCFLRARALDIQWIPHMRCFDLCICRLKLRSSELSCRKSFQGISSLILLSKIIPRRPEIVGGSWISIWGANSSKNHPKRHAHGWHSHILVFERQIEHVFLLQMVWPSFLWQRFVWEMDEVTKCIGLHLHWPNLSVEFVARQESTPNLAGSFHTLGEMFVVMNRSRCSYILKTCQHLGVTTHIRTIYIYIIYTVIIYDLYI